MLGVADRSVFDDEACQEKSFFVPSGNGGGRSEARTEYYPSVRLDLGDGRRHLPFYLWKSEGFVLRREKTVRVDCNGRIL